MIEVHREKHRNSQRCRSRRRNPMENPGQGVVGQPDRTYLASTDPHPLSAQRVRRILNEFIMLILRHHWRIPERGTRWALSRLECQSRPEYHLFLDHLPDTYNALDPDGRHRFQWLLKRLDLSYRHRYVSPWLKMIKMNLNLFAFVQNRKLKVRIDWTFFFYL